MTEREGKAFALFQRVIYLFGMVPRSRDHVCLPSTSTLSLRKKSQKKRMLLAGDAGRA